MRGTKSLIFSIVICLCIGFETMAQTAAVFSDEIILYRGERFMPFIDGPIEQYAFSTSDFTRQQMKMVGTMREKLNDVTAILKSSELFHPPQGFKLVIHSGATPPVGFHNNLSLGGTIRFELFVTMVCNEKPCYDKKTDATVVLNFNNPNKLAAVPIVDEFWVQPGQLADFHGYPAYRLFDNRREIVVVGSNDVPLYLPVTREEFILVLIKHFGEIYNKLSQQAVQPAMKEAKIGFSEEETKKRQTDFDSTFEQMNRFDPLLARKLKDNYEEVERMLRAANSDTTVVVSQSQVMNMQMRIWREGIRKLRTELNAMNPSERYSQAHWSESEVTNTSGLMPAGHPGSHPVIRINPDIMDDSRSETDIQLLTIEWNEDLAPFSNLKMGRNLQYNRLWSLSQNGSIWHQIFELVTAKP